MGRNLVYTLALDPKGQTGHRNLAKMLVSSLLRTRFTGDIMVFHNSPLPLYMVAREGVREVQMGVPKKVGPALEFVAYAQSCKHAVTKHIDAAAYDKVMFIDCDSVVLQNIDHMFAGDWDLAVTIETGSRIQQYGYAGYLKPRERRLLRRPGKNSGTWAVSGPRFHEFLRWWREVESRPSRRGCLREQSAFNRVALDWDGALHPWPHGEIALPLVTGHVQTYVDFSRATIVHAASGAPADYKLRFLFGMFAGAFLFDSQLALFNTIEM